VHRLLQLCEVAVCVAEMEDAPYGGHPGDLTRQDFVGLLRLHLAAFGLMYSEGFRGGSVGMRTSN
jgi:hypothetical protein